MKESNAYSIKKGEQRPSKRNLVRKRDISKQIEMKMITSSALTSTNVAIMHNTWQINCTDILINVLKGQ